MEDVVLVAAVRTPIGKFLGGLSGFRAPELGSKVIAEALKRAALSPKDVDEVIMGNVLAAGVGQNPARQAALGAGLPDTIAALTINKVCGSSLKAVMLAAQAIKAGDAKIIVAGGQESMSNAPYLLPRARTGLRLGDATLVDSMIYDGLTDFYHQIHMGNTAETVSQRYKISRHDADAFALRSHTRAARATQSGRFRDEILAVEAVRDGTTQRVVADEGIRANSTTESLARLKPAFKDGGLVTAGNSSQLSDGASAVVVMSAKEASRRKIDPLATIRGYDTSGVKPEWIMEAPIPSVRALLKKTGKTIEDIDLLEHNEAFAAASCAVRNELKVPDEKFNVNGGAVALGHPIGASGTRVLTTLLYALKAGAKRRGIATLCLGGGNAVSMLVERA